MNCSEKRTMKNEKRKAVLIAIGSSLFALCFSLPLSAAPTANAPAAGGGKSVTPDEMEVQIKGQFKGRLMIKKIVAPVTMNLEKLQDFPEDPSQKILLEPLPTSEAAQFNASKEVKAHAPFWPWIPPVAEPPFLSIVPNLRK